jgi:phage/plasmid-associated DNA primase
MDGDAHCQWLKLLSKFLGKENCASSDLDALAGNNYSRFESAKLFRKLACLMGETNFGLLESSSILKKLTGGDLMSFEIKNKDPFSDYNYAKIIIASNSLPRSEDTSDGFYRRWIIVGWPNQFKEGKDIVDAIPDIEFNNLANKITKILPDLLQRGEFTNQGTIEKRQMDYMMASNPITYFVNQCCEQGDNSDDYFVTVNVLYNAYGKFLHLNKRRVVSRKEFLALLELEGFYSRKTSKTITMNGSFDKKYETSYFIEGLKLKSDFMLFMLISTNFTTPKPALVESCKTEHNKHNWNNFIYNSNLLEHETQKDEKTGKNFSEEYVIDNIEKKDEMSYKSEKITPRIIEKIDIFHRCIFCGLTPCVAWNSKGQPVCEFCAETLEKNNEQVTYQQ